MSRAMFAVLMAVLTAMTIGLGPLSSYASHMLGSPTAVPLSARSLAMGMTGVADLNDPANFFYNPANLIAVDGVYLSACWGDILPAIDISQRSLGAAIGVHDRSDSQNRLHGAAGVHYLRYVVEWWVTTPSGERPEKDEWVWSSLPITFAGAVDISKHLRLALGVSAKSVGWDLPAVTQQTGRTDLAGRVLMWDLGGTLSAGLGTSSGWKISPALGAAWIDLGDTISYNVAPLLSRRLLYGVAVSLDTPASSSINAMFKHEVPLLSVRGNLDWWEWTETDDPKGKGWGIELVMVDVLAIRYGGIDDGEYLSGNSYGIGVGFSYTRFSASFDYASFPQYHFWEEENSSTYGFRFGYRL